MKPFFVRNKQVDVNIVKNILITFEGALGQKINCTKFMIYFSPNTLSNKNNHFSNILGLRSVDSMDNYLGVSLLIGKNKTNTFRQIKAR